MSTLLDDRIGMKVEGTFNSPVTVDRFYPFLDGTTGEWDPRPRQGQGLMGGSGMRSMLGSRWFVTIGQGTVTIKAELESKNAGVLLGAAFGVASLAVITGGAQQIFHNGITGTTKPSYTIQVVKVLNSGAEQVETFIGCTATKVKVDQPKDGIATIEVTFDVRSLSKVIAAAAQVYVLGVLFDHSQATSVGLGGSFTAPTTTALATGPTAFSDVVSYSIELDHSANIDRRVLGSRNQPLIGMPVGTVSATVEWNATTVTDAYIAGTKLPFQVTYTTTESVGAGFSQLQFAIPQLVLTGDLVQPKPGDVREVDVKAEIKNDGTNRDLYAVYRSLDTAA